MTRRKLHRAALLALLVSLPLTSRASSVSTAPLAEQREALLRELAEVNGLGPERVERMRAIVEGSSVLGQGNPAITVHPATREECERKLSTAGLDYRNAEFEEICGERYMAPLYDPSKETARGARACIDRFEFPNVPCAYPVVWVRAREAAQLCEALGKRLCDAHEWEGGCAGSLEEPDYFFDLAKDAPPAVAIPRMRAAHNRIHDSKKVWSYGPAYRTGICAASSSKSPGCEGGSWTQCGSNTFPSGFFPDCHSPLGVYDINGNAAEHMNLPVDESQMASRGGPEYGYTEMKGSWFIFDSYKAHEDACRWRAPYWHGSRVMAPDSHHNYHLGFRCCKTLE